MSLKRWKICFVCDKEEKWRWVFLLNVSLLAHNFIDIMTNDVMMAFCVNKFQPVTAA